MRVNRAWPFLPWHEVLSWLTHRVELLSRAILGSSAPRPTTRTSKKWQNIIFTLVNERLIHAKGNHDRLISNQRQNQMTRDLMAVCEDSENNENWQKTVHIDEVAEKLGGITPSAFLAGELNFRIRSLKRGICWIKVSKCQLRCLERPNSALLLSSGGPLSEIFNFALLVKSVLDFKSWLLLRSHPVIN